jgi:purine-nucleoside phosphorylase
MKKEESRVRPEFSGPEIPEGYLIFIPFLPYPGLITEIAKAVIKTLKIYSGQLFYLNNKAVLYGGVGAPASIITLEKIRLLGVKRITLLSYCGSLSENLSTAMAFLPDSALSDEGTSRHYLYRRNNLFYPNKKSVLKIKSYLNRHNLPYAIGSIVSTDAPYRETLSWIKKMQKKRQQAVDMEVSAVLAFSEFYGIKAAGLFIVSDELFGGKWVNGLLRPSVLESTRKYFLPLIFDQST